MNRIIVNILAGGIGTRMGKGCIPKQFLKIDKQPIFIKTILMFKKISEIEKAILVMPAFFIKSAEKVIKKYKLENYVTVIEGGTKRQESSYKALQYIEKNGGCDIVLIHDAVRPFITEKIIKESIIKAKEFGASEVSVPAIDTLVSSYDGKIVDEILNRNKIYYTQTPQTFRFDIIMNAHKKFQNTFDATDDAMLVMKCGQKVQIVEGSYDNIKITSPKDFALAKLIQRVKQNCNNI